MPGGRERREQHDALAAYMLPFFGQSWSVFAPDPVNGDYGFEVRAARSDGGETEWVSATDVELSMIRYTLFPPRAGIQASEVAAGYQDAFDALDQAQRAVIADDFSDGGRPGGGGAPDAGGLRAALEQRVDPANAAGSAADAERILAEERRATAYATQVAKAVWGDGVERVQFRVSRQNVVPFAQRGDPDAQRPEPVVVRPGWRAPVVEPGQNEENFADVFRRQLERMGR